MHGNSREHEWLDRARMQKKEKNTLAMHFGYCPISFFDFRFPEEWGIVKKSPGELRILRDVRNFGVFPHSVLTQSAEI